FVFFSSAYILHNNKKKKNSPTSSSSPFRNILTLDLFPIQNIFSVFSNFDCMVGDLRTSTGCFFF
ncbi:hypothetical protein DERF_005200, partial [Dermatophagoides farinae]